MDAAVGPGGPDGGRGLVLIVEDDRAIADLVGRYLRRDGFGVHVEGDGAAGLAAVRLVNSLLKPLGSGPD